jgi:subtilisin family serine protease
LKYGVVLALAAVLAAGAAGSSPAGPAPQSYIVVYKSGVDTDAKTAALEHAQGFQSRFRYHSALRGFAATLNDQQLARVESDPDVDFVSPDGEVHAVDALGAGESVPSGVMRINAATSTLAEPAASVNVAVIDTGIDLNYTSELNAVSGKNCINTSQPAQDDNGHGTHVSGTIAAKNTTTGLVGVAPGTRLYAVKVLNSAGSGTTAQVVCGIDWVTANASALNIRVASMSLGGSGSNDNNCGHTPPGDAMHTAICNSKAAGVTYVVAAGNSTASFSSFVPAAYPEVVAVTALSDADGQPGAAAPLNFCGLDWEGDDVYANFSNYAPSGDSAAVARTIAAPGVCITSTWLGGGTAIASGTSMATPHVSGAVALCITAGNCTAGGSPASIVSAIRTTDPTEGFTGDPNHSPIAGRYYGYIVWTPTPPPPPPPPTATVPGAPSLSAAPARGKGVQLTWSTPADGGSPITNYRVYRGTTSGGESQLTTLGTVNSYKDTSGTRGQTYYYKVSAVNTMGEGQLSNESPATAR